MPHRKVFAFFYFLKNANFRMYQFTMSVMYTVLGLARLESFFFRWLWDFIFFCPELLYKGDLTPIEKT